MWKRMAVAALILSPVMASAQEALFSADGYRITHYRAPVPEAPEGVKRIAAVEVAKLRPRRAVILIDVYPAEGGRREADGTWRLAVPRRSLPGAHWFPEAGRGDVAPEIGEWFEKGVARLTRGNRARPIVVFCLADCWMSWNAARRLGELGYTDVRWFAEGTDGWSDIGGPLVTAWPERP